MPPESPPDDPSPTQFSIATPADWMVVDFDVLGDRAVIGGLVDRRVEEEPALGPYRDELAELVARSATLAGAAGVTLCATLATVRDDGAPILAAMTIAAGEQDQPEPGGAGHARPGADNRGGQVLINRIDEPDGSARYAPVVVELPCGLAARVEHVDDVPLFSDTSVVFLTVQYLVNVPDRPDEFVALTFTTPSLAYRARLTDLFGEIASTFAWVQDEAGMRHQSEDAAVVGD